MQTHSSVISLIKRDRDAVKPYCWWPGDPIEAGDRDGAPYAAWIKTGHLTAIGNSTDPRVIALKIAELNGLHRFTGLAFDRWRVAEIKRELDAIGCSVPLIEHGQGFGWRVRDAAAERGNVVSDPFRRRDCQLLVGKDAIPTDFPIR